MDFQFDERGKRLTAVDAGWKKNGQKVYEIQDETGSCVDTVTVHPLDSIEDAIDTWRKTYQG
ncbi:MAG: hypothetical protein JWR85_4031 [Marmoricola sp.]|jgi:hypothetical protein|nr:hypothetical protein [Marmoricola sp.]